MRAGLRLLEQQETALAALRAALIDGEDSGRSTAFDFEDFIALTRQVSPSADALAASEAPADMGKARSAADAIRAMSKHVKLDDDTMKDLIGKGRR